MAQLTFLLHNNIPSFLEKKNKTDLLCSKQLLPALLTGFRRLCYNVHSWFQKLNFSLLTVSEGITGFTGTSVLGTRALEGASPELHAVGQGAHTSCPARGTHTASCTRPTLAPHSQPAQCCGHSSHHHVQAHRKGTLKPPGTVVITNCF